MFNIMCENIDKNLTIFNDFDSVLEIKKWEFSERGIKKMYRTDDHIELVVDPDIYLIEKITIQNHPVDFELYDEYPIRITWKKQNKVM